MHGISTSSLLSLPLQQKKKKESCQAEDPQQQDKHTRKAQKVIHNSQCAPGTVRTVNYMRGRHCPAVLFVNTQDLPATFTSRSEARGSRTPAIQQTRQASAAADPPRRDTHDEGKSIRCFNPRAPPPSPFQADNQSVPPVVLLRFENSSRSYWKRRVHAPQSQARVSERVR